MLKRFLLQMFGEEGSADGGESSAQASEAGENIPSSIPARARKLYSETVGKNKSTVQPQETEAKKPSYAELIKSDDYKEEHKAYMESTLNDRLKKYKGVESENKAMRNALNTVAQKYGIEDGEDFLERLGKAIEEDDSYYEKYASEHDMLPSEARKLATLERKAQAYEAQQKALAEEEARREQIRVLQTNAEKTKYKYPSFDLATEMQNPAFVRICASTNGDTTSAYIAVHHDEIFNGAIAKATQDARNMTVNAVASGKGRPLESGVNASAPSQSVIDFNSFTLNDIRAYAEAQRKSRR